MPLERETILVDNLLACLNLYQRSLVWALTASLAFFLLTLRLRDPSQPHVPLLSIEIHLATAWCLALALFLVFGGFALSALHRAEAILPQLNPPPRITRSHPVISFPGNKPKHLSKSRRSPSMSYGDSDRNGYGTPARVNEGGTEVEASTMGNVGRVFPPRSHHPRGVWCARTAGLATVWVSLTSG